jgi:uncharacterized PurR-regulated membrane protein YhhQ (DUF165 family)
MSAFVYLCSVVLVNVGFVHLPSLAILWSVIVGLCFVLRDWCQHEFGHKSLAFMGVACGISFWLASPQVAIASAAAFGISELIDWGIYTATKKPMALRVLLSSAVSVPVDSFVFLAGIGILSWTLFATQVISKMVAAVVVYAILRRPAPALGR